VTTAQYQGLSMGQAFAYMWKNEGFVGFFKGNGVNIVKIAPFSALEFYFYELFKKHLFKHQNDWYSKLVCGGLTGIAAQTLVSNPRLHIGDVIVEIHTHSK
jgi:solute carrier family 25 phosphate transporter 23/24/25/41